MSRESPEHVHSQVGHVSSSSSLPSLSGENESLADIEYPSPQPSLSSPSSPTPTADASSMGAAQDRDRASGPQRSRSASRNHDAAGDKSKRKRSRVTPEQLAHLERFFATDRSPTAARRKEISEMLGMQERQTQIWFQNRRAKAKLMDGKYDQESLEQSSDMPPALSAGWDAELQILVHEDEPITIIPCTELTIGSWRRVASAVSRYDLVAYICHTRQRLAWFIHSSGCGFKMEIPFDTVIDTKFVNSTPGMGQASFILSHPPLFYMEVPSPETADDGLPTRIWKPSTDWTEKMQATKVFRHDLVGAAIQLAHVLRTVTSSKPGTSVSLYPLSYDSKYPPPLPSRSPSALSPPTMAGIVADDIAGPSQPQQSGGVSQQRRFSRGSLYYQEPSLDLSVSSSPSSSVRASYGSLPPRVSPLPSPAYGMSPEHAIGPAQAIYQDHSIGPSPEPFHPLHVPISHSISRRSFSGASGSVTPQRDIVFGNEDVGLTPSISYKGRRHSASSDSVSPSTPLTQAMASLGTTHPPSSWDNRRSNVPPNYLLGGEYPPGSTSSPHPGYSSQNYLPP